MTLCIAMEQPSLQTTLCCIEMEQHITGTTITGTTITEQPSASRWSHHDTLHRDGATMTLCIEMVHDTLLQVSALEWVTIDINTAVASEKQLTNEKCASQPSSGWSKSSPRSPHEHDHHCRRRASPTLSWAVWSTTGDFPSSM